MSRILSACSLLLVASSCATPHLSLMPRVGNFEPQGDILLSGTAGTVGANASNSLDALGFVEDDGVPGLRADVAWGVSHWTIAWQKSEHGGTGTLDAEISDDDVSIAAGTQVDTVFDMGLGEFLLTFDVFPGDRIELGIGLGATVFDLDVSVTDPLSGDTVDPDRATLPVPLLALRAGVQFWRMDVQALLAGMKVSYDGDSASLYDLDAFARLNLFGEGHRAHGALIVGYRRLDLDVNYDNDDGTESLDVDIAFDGPYVGLSLGI